MKKFNGNKKAIMKMLFSVVLCVTLLADSLVLTGAAVEPSAEPMNQTGQAVTEPADTTLDATGTDNDGTNEPAADTDESEADAEEEENEDSDNQESQEEPVLKPVAIDEEHFKDEHFRNAVKELCDLDGDFILSEEELKQVTKLDLSNRAIQSLQGIENFVNLKKLNCSDNMLTSLSLAKLTKLKELICENNRYEIQLTEEVSFDLNSLPGFVLDKADTWSGGTVSEEGLFTLPEGVAEGDFTYRYYYNEPDEKTAEEIAAEETKETVAEETKGTAAEVSETPKERPYVVLTLRFVRIEHVQETAASPTETPTAAPTKPPLGLERTTPAAQKAPVVTAPTTKKARPKAKITSLKYKKKATASIKIKKISGVSGYEVLFATNKKYTANRRTKTLKKTSGTLTGLLAKKYYVKVRAYKIDSKGKKTYYPYSSTKTVKIKKGLSQVNPTSKSVTIQSCKITSGTKVKVTAKLKNVLKSKDNYYYLFALPSYKSKISSGTKALAKSQKVTSPSFTCNLNAGQSSSVLQSKFVVAVKVKGGYKAVSKARYITNPTAIAKYRKGFPKQSSKKGLQVNTSMGTDTKNLGVQHATVNIPLDWIIAKGSEINSGNVITYRYNGKNYYFSTIMYEYDKQIQALCSQDITVTAILLMQYNQELSYLISSGGRSDGHGTYALNNNSQASRQQLEATFTFLAERYSANRSMFVPNWILSNEVNNHDSGNYAGNVSFSKYVDIYATSFRMLSTAVHSVYNNARLYISMDHLWNTQLDTTYTGKSFLDAFAKRIKEQGNIPWHIAYHAYPSPLTSPCFWANVNGQIDSRLTSAVINMGNLNVLTNYVKKTYGSSHRIILSEQGFTSNIHGSTDEKMQAAAIAYAYYVAEFNGMIDSFILHRHVDHREEMEQGLYLGLWANNTSQVEYASRKKYAWDMFRYLDTPSSIAKTQFAKLKIGINNWSTVVPGFNTNKFNKM